MPHTESIWQHSRAYVLAIAAFGGIFMFGYDTGLGGGLIALPSFQRTFGLIGLDAKARADKQGNIVSILQGGCLCGAILVAPITTYIGRLRSLILNCLFFFVGAALMTAATTLPMFMGGRFVVGFGVGAMSTVCPTYVSELAPKHIRGRLSGLFQVIVVTGVAAAYWIVYGVQHINPARGNIQWRIPVGFQLAPVGIMFIVLFFMKESPRWLATNHKNELALKNLAWIRKTSEDDPDTQAEFAEILASVEEEARLAKNRTWKELRARPNWIRFAIAIGVFTIQQWSGQNSVNYYAPQIFTSIGITGSSTSLLASGIYGIVKIVATTIFVLFGIERFGRKWSLVVGLTSMSLALWIIGAIFITNPPNPNATDPSKASIAMAAMIYIFVIPYCFSIGPIPWVYCAEIFNNRTRAWGLMTASASQWVWNLILTRYTPLLINALKNGGVFFFFASLCLIGAAICSTFPETRGRSLEEMDIIFGAITQEERDVHLAQIHANKMGATDEFAGDEKTTEEVRRERV